MNFYDICFIAVMVAFLAHIMRNIRIMRTLRKRAEELKQRYDIEINTAYLCGYHDGQYNNQPKPKTQELAGTEGQDK